MQQMALLSTSAQASLMLWTSKLQVGLVGWQRKMPRVRRLALQVNMANASWRMVLRSVSSIAIVCHVRQGRRPFRQEQHRRMCVSCVVLGMCQLLEPQYVHLAQLESMQQAMLRMSKAV
jgi:hypothetical protein